MQNSAEHYHVPLHMIVILYRHGTCGQSLHITRHILQVNPPTTGLNSGDITCPKSMVRNIDPPTADSMVISYEITSKSGNVLRLIQVFVSALLFV